MKRPSTVESRALLHRSDGLYERVGRGGCRRLCRRRNAVPALLRALRKTSDPASIHKPPTDQPGAPGIRFVEAEDRSRSRPGTGRGGHRRVARRSRSLTRASRRSSPPRPSSFREVFASTPSRRGGCAEPRKKMGHRPGGWHSRRHRGARLRRGDRGRREPLGDRAGGPAPNPPDQPRAITDRQYPVPASSVVQIPSIVAASSGTVRVIARDGSIFPRRRLSIRSRSGRRACGRSILMIRRSRASIVPVGIEREGDEHRCATITSLLPERAERRAAAREARVPAKSSATSV